NGATSLTISTPLPASLTSILAFVFLGTHMSQCFLSGKTARSNETDWSMSGLSLTQNISSIRAASANRGTETGGQHIAFTILKRTSSSNCASNTIWRQRKKKSLKPVCRHCSPNDLLLEDRNCRLSI